MRPGTIPYLILPFPRVKRNICNQHLLHKLYKSITKNRHYMYCKSHTRVCVVGRECVYRVNAGLLSIKHETKIDTVRVCRAHRMAIVNSKTRILGVVPNICFTHPKLRQSTPGGGLDPSNNESSLNGHFQFLDRSSSFFDAKSNLTSTTTMD